MNDKEFFEWCDKYEKILSERGHDEFTYTLSLREVAILHGLLSFVVEQGLPKMESGTLEFIQKFRAWYKQVWVDVGLTEEEADFFWFPEDKLI